LYGNALPVDPGIQVIGCRGTYDLLDKVKVFTRVVNEDVGHNVLPLYGYRKIVQDINA